MAVDLKASIVVKLIDAATAPLKEINKQMVSMGTSIAAAKKASAGAFAFSRDLNQSAQAVNAFAAQARAAVAAPVTAAMRFQDSLIEVEKKTQASAETMKQFQEASLAMGMDGEFAADAVALAMAGTARAGEDAAVVIDRVRQASVLADAANMDLSATTNMVTGIMRSYGLAAADQARVQDILITSGQQTGDSVDSIGASLAGISVSVHF